MVLEFVAGSFAPGLLLNSSRYKKMILKNTQIIWKLKEGTVLKYGPHQDTNEEVKTSEVAVKSECVQEVPHEIKSETTEQSSLSELKTDSVLPSPETSTVSQEPPVSDGNGKDVQVNTQIGRIEQAYPESVNANLVNLANTSPVVDGVVLNSPNTVQPLGARWQSLPYRLRAKRADVFVDMQSSVDYLNSLVDFLISKGLDVKEYNDEVRYLPSDIILADASRLIDAGTVLVLQRGKRYIWEALLKEFGARLNGK